MSPRLVRIDAVDTRTGSGHRGSRPGENHAVLRSQRSGSVVPGVVF